MEEANVDAIELCWKDLKVTSNTGKTLLQGASGKIQGSFMAVFFLLFICNAYNNDDDVIIITVKLFYR